MEECFALVAFPEVFEGGPVEKFGHAEALLGFLLEFGVLDFVAGRTETSFKNVKLVVVEFGHQVVQQEQNLGDQLYDPVTAEAPSELEDVELLQMAEGFGVQRLVPLVAR